MLGNASEIKLKRIVYVAPFAFSLEDYQKQKTLDQLVIDWLNKHNNAEIVSISCYAREKLEICMIFYKEDSN